MRLVRIECKCNEKEILASIDDDTHELITECPLCGNKKIRITWIEPNGF